MLIPRTRLAILVVAAVFCPPTAEVGPAPGTAGRLIRYEITCPVCRQVFTAVTCSGANTDEGVDRDLFGRASGPQPEYYRIATCPRCGYSGYETDFRESGVVPADVRNRILKRPQLTLPKGFTPASDPLDLDAAVRYELAITCYQWQKRSDEALAWLHLRAAWIQRDEGSALPPDRGLARVMEFARMWRPKPTPKDNQAEVEMQLATRIAEAVAGGRFTRYQRPYVDLTLAMLLRRHGENRQAAPMLDGLIESNPFPTALQDAIRRMRDSIDRERKHQVAAAECFERALLGNQISEANRPAACYLLGELNRRIGRDREAVRWYDQALESPGVDEQLKTWADQQRAWAAAGEVEN